MKSQRISGIALLCLAIAIPCFQSGCTQQSLSAPASPVAMLKSEVVVDEVAQEDVQLYLYAEGRTEPYKYVDITARVPGYLEQLFFRSGSIVKEGDRLALIEQDQYEIALEAAKAELANAEARSALTKANLERGKQLVESRALSPEEFQDRQAAFDMSQATVALCKANVRKAELDLRYTDIRAPIPGKTTKNLLDVGNYISPGSESAKLLSIAQMDPIYIDFFISDRQFADLKERMGFWENYERKIQQVDNADQAEDKSNNGNAEKIKQILPALNGNYDKSEKGRIDVSLTTGVDVMTADFPLSGHIVALVDNRITYETGQITLRGEVRNPLLLVDENEDYMLYPGQICRVRIPYDLVKDAVLVHEEAILTDLDTKYVLVLKKEQFVSKDRFGQPMKDPATGQDLPATEEYVVHRRDIIIGRLLDTQQRIVHKGLEKGETYIVKGVQRARIGVPVDPITLEEHYKRRMIVGGSATAPKQLPDKAAGTPSTVLSEGPVEQTDTASEPEGVIVKPSSESPETQP